MTDPVLVYDDACGFCTWWAHWAVARAPIHPVGFSTLSQERRDRLPDDFERCVHLLADGRVYSCGEAVEATLVRLDFVPSRLQDPGPIRRSSPYRRIRELGYRWVAENRDTLSKIVSRKPRRDEAESADSS